MDEYVVAAKIAEAKLVAQEGQSCGARSWLALGVPPPNQEISQELMEYPVFMSRGQRERTAHAINYYGLRNTTVGRVRSSANFPSGERDHEGSGVGKKVTQKTVLHKSFL